MSCVENVNLSVRYIPAIGLRLREFEREVILAPNHQQPRLPFVHPRLPLGVGVDVRAVVIEEVALNVHLTRLTKKGKLVCLTAKGRSPIGPIATSFRGNILSVVVEPDLREFMKMAIPASAIARAIAYAIEQPVQVEVDEMVIRPTVQDF